MTAPASRPLPDSFHTLLLTVTVRAKLATCCMAWAKLLYNSVIMSCNPRMTFKRLQCSRVSMCALASACTLASMPCALTVHMAREPACQRRFARGTVGSPKGRPSADESSVFRTKHDRMSFLANVTLVDVSLAPQGDPLMLVGQFVHFMHPAPEVCRSANV